jgi:hypothetical protein
MTLHASLDHTLRRVPRLSNDELRAELLELVRAHRHLTAALLVHLGEVDARRLHASWAYSSLFGYCVGALGFSEDEAYKRIAAARVARKFPGVLELVQAGRLHLTGLLLVAPHLSPENPMELLGAACDKTKREIEKLIAERFPRPDVPASVRHLPTASPGAAGSMSGLHRSPAAPSATASAASALSTDAPNGSPAPASAPSTTLPSGSADSASCSAPSSQAIENSASRGAAPENDRRVESSVPDATVSPQSAIEDVSARSQPPMASPPARRADRHRIEPLAPERYRVTFTASAALIEKLERAQELASHAVPPNDLTALFERALDALIAREEKRRYATKAAPDAGRGGRRRSTAGAASAGLAPGGVNEPLNPTARAEVAPGRVDEPLGPTARAEVVPERVDEPLGPTARAEVVPERVDEPLGPTARAEVAPGRVDEPLGSLPKTVSDEPPSGARRSRYVPARVRRAVLARDGNQCTFVDGKTGHRCGERRFLELEHIEPHALGGPATAENLRIVCSAHNALLARRAFGERYVAAAVARGPTKVTSCE